MNRALSSNFILSFYRVLTWLLSPIFAIVLWFRALAGKEDRSRINERKGKPQHPRPPGNLIWLHGTSVGESMVGLSLAKELRKTIKGSKFLFTSTTMTAAKVVAKSLSEGDIHQYIPIDTVPAVRRFLNHFTPNLAIFLEGEIWPNLILATKSRGIPLALVNARMTEKSINNWQKHPKTALQLFGSFDYIHAADVKTKAALEQLGGRAINDFGNLKLAAPAPFFIASEVKTISDSNGNRPIWLAASTHQGEEEIILAAHNKLLETLPNALLIIAPRHPKRADEVFKLCTGNVKRRSLGQSADLKTQVYLWDTIGELGSAFKLAKVSFMAGSLLPNIGGHNPIEPAQLGSAVLSGKFVHNFQGIFEDMAAQNAVKIAIDSNYETISVEVFDLLTAPEKLEAMTSAALKYTQSSKKVLDKVALKISKLLEEKI